ncbi:unnamed protein product [Cuscuta campestris]|uniref:CCHC-type domain-containing protein n=1 Tax=Cuscuta campestris TaxID=132261 RepID=A0A484NPS2_9ASTE|nr:unnamed protein product [Cuscuta campestris]
MELNGKAINIIYCGVNADDYRKISRCETTKQMWEKLEITYEGTTQVREAKIDQLTHEYELFSMKENEKVEEMFERFSNIINPLNLLGKVYTDRELVRKVLRSLSPKWRSKADAIEEARGFQTMTYDSLRDDDSDHSDIGLFVWRFKKMMNQTRAKKNTPPKCYGCGEIGHIKPMCPKLKNEKDKKAPKKQRAYISWENDGSGSDDSEAEEMANLCLMAIEEDQASKEFLPISNSFFPALKNANLPHFVFSIALAFVPPPLPDPFFFCPKSVPSLAAMIISDSDSASASSNSRQADQSASGCDLSQTQSSQPSPLAMPGQKLRRLRKQFPSSTLARGGSRVKMDENIMALCHCQITDRGFVDATDMVGPSIEVLRPTSTQTALDAPSGCKDVGVKPTLDHFLFTFKLTKGHKDWASYASLSQRSSKLFTSDKKGSTKDWKPFFVFVSTGPESPFTGSGLQSFHRIPCPPPDATLLSITRQLCGQRAAEIKEVVTEESLVALGFEFVQDELLEPQGLEKEMDSDLLLGRFVAGKKRKRDATKPSKSKRSSSRGEDGPSCEQVVIEVEDQDDAALGTGMMAINPTPRSLVLGGDLAGSSQEAFSERPRSPPAVTYEATLGMIELVGRRQDLQAVMDAERRAIEDKQRELQEEVARLARESEVEKEGEKTDLIQQLEVEKSDQARRVEEAIELFKSSPDFAAVAMERMDKLAAEWLKTEPGAQWMVKEVTKSFNCGLFRAQQVFRSKLARLPKGFSFPDLGLPPPCHALAEFDPSPYLDEGSSSASDEEEEETVDDQDGQGDQDPAANQAASKAGGSASSGI